MRITFCISYFILPKYSNAASDLGLHCLPVLSVRILRYVRYLEPVNIITILADAFDAADFTSRGRTDILQRCRR